MKNRMLLVILAIFCFVGTYFILILDEFSIHRYGFRKDDTMILADAPVFTCKLDENSNLIISHPNEAYPDVLGPREKMLRLSLNDVINISASEIFCGESNGRELDNAEKTKWFFELSEGITSKLQMMSTIPGGTSIYRSASDQGHFAQIRFSGGDYSGTLVLYNGQDEYVFVPMEWTNIEEVANRGLFQIEKLIVAVVAAIILVSIGVCILMLSSKGTRGLMLYVMTVVAIIILVFLISALSKNIFWNWDSLPNKVIL